jgi:NitT/TauT family transport system permease protein
MSLNIRIFRTGQSQRLFGWGDLIALLFVLGLIAGGATLAARAPVAIQGPEISLDPAVLPVYAALSTGRMLLAYLLSLIFIIFYGRAAAYNRRAERVLMPLLDVLQSVPILSFLPVVLLSLNALLPDRAAAELAAIVLIFTSQAWNLAFGWYQSLTTIPKELREAGAIFQFNSWIRFRRLELPFGTISLVWNSMMSWAGGWFFLMASETFTVGARDFRLPGIGSYLQTAAAQGNLTAILFGVATLVLVILLMDQFVWRPLLAWSERFTLSTVSGDNAPESWFLNAINNSRLVGLLNRHVVVPLSERIDAASLKRLPAPDQMPRSRSNRLGWALIGLLSLVGLAGVIFGGGLLLALDASGWLRIGSGLVWTALRVAVALLFAAAWTIPVGVAIGVNPRLASVAQPVVQVLASIPATALFPIILVIFLRIQGGLNLAAVLLMLLGTQWYMLFNIIAGAGAIPQDLKNTARLMGLRGWRLWRILILPGLFPFLVTGAITAAGGAWNASIVAEQAVVAGQTYSTPGIGSTIAAATASGNYPLLLGGTLGLILTVVLINRLLWRRLYTLAADRYRME